MNFEFREIHRSYGEPYLQIFREITTDCLFLRYRDYYSSAGFGGLTQMLDPQTGKPLTYANWCEKYKNKNDNL